VVRCDVARAQATAVHHHRMHALLRAAQLRQGGGGHGAAYAHLQLREGTEITAVASDSGRDQGAAGAAALVCSVWREGPPGGFSAHHGAEEGTSSQRI
jgi:hypothetical protein